MSSLAAGFATRMRKQAEGSEGETTLKSYGKWSKQSSLGEKAQKDWAIILVDSLNRASNDQPVLEGAPNEAGAPLEMGILAEGPSNVNEIRDKASSGVAAAPMLPPRPSDTEPSRKRLPDKVLLIT